MIANGQHARLCASIATIAIGGALSAGGALSTASIASPPQEVVLGSRAFAGSHGEGWGAAKPARIFNGGDPSGLVTHIHWENWGGASAIGYGLNAIFKPHGGYYHQLARIELRAQRLGRCSAGGPRAYTQLSFRVPAYPGGPLGKWTLWSGAKSICKFAF
jgi:hypothetical protein